MELLPGFLIHHNLVLLFLVGEVFIFYVFYIPLSGICDLVIQVEVAAQKAWRKILCNTQHIMHDQYLAIHLSAGTNAYYDDPNNICTGSGNVYVMAWYGSSSNAPQTGDDYLQYGSTPENNTGSYITVNVATNPHP